MSTFNPFVWARQFAEAADDAASNALSESGYSAAEERRCMSGLVRLYRELFTRLCEVKLLPIDRAIRPELAEVLTAVAEANELSTHAVGRGGAR